MKPIHKMTIEEKNREVAEWLETNIQKHKMQPIIPEKVFNMKLP